MFGKPRQSSLLCHRLPMSLPILFCCFFNISRIRSKNKFIHQSSNSPYHFKQDPQQGFTNRMFMGTCQGLLIKSIIVFSTLCSPAILIQKALRASLCLHECNTYSFYTTLKGCCVASHCFRHFEKTHKANHEILCS